MSADTDTHEMPPIDMSMWQGRVDPEPDSPRWHQCVQPWKADARPGAALLGFASDAGVKRNQGRPGAANGPLAIRRALANLAWHRQAPVHDAGTVECDGDALEEAQQCLAERVADLLHAGQLPIVLGGGHEVAYGSWQGLAGHLEAQQSEAPRVGIINLDAHFDLRDPQHGHSSGTSFTQIAEACHARRWPFRYACLGVSRASNTRALFQRAENLGVLIREDREFSTTQLDTILRDVKHFIAHCGHLYLTIDLDVLPAAEAPGVSAPAARGVALALLEPLVEIIRDSGKLRLVDIAELNPEYDIDNRTAKGAARLVHQLTLTG